MARYSPVRKGNTYAFALIAILVFVFGVWFLYLGGDDTAFWRARQGLHVFLANLGGLLIASVAIGILWDFFGKRSFAREVLESARIAAEIETAGLTRVGTNYITDADWADLFKGVEKLDIFVAYGQTWRNSNLGHLQALAKRKSGRLRVYLADPTDNETMKVLAHRFEKDANELRKNVLDTKAAYEDLRIEGGASIEIFNYAGDRTFAFYRFDNVAVVTFYRHRRGRSQNVPMLLCKSGGTLYEFVREELDYIRTASKPA